MAQVVNRNRLPQAPDRGAGGNGIAQPHANPDMINGNRLPGPQPHQNHQQSSQFSMIIMILAIFIASVVILFGIYTTFPEMDDWDRKNFKLPRSMEETSTLVTVLGHYTDEHYFHVMLGIVVFYIMLQTFAIPGSIFLSVMCGSLFHWSTALFLICFCSATGATFCYLISYAIGRGFVRKWFPGRVEKWSKSVRKHRDNIIHYMVFLRITPIFPNWFINISAPVLDVPIKPFYIGTFVGVAIPSLVAIHTGTMLHEYAASGGEPLSYWSLGLLGVFGFMALIPILIKRMVGLGDNEEVN